MRESENDVVNGEDGEDDDCDDATSPGEASGWQWINRAKSTESSSVSL